MTSQQTLGIIQSNEDVDSGEKKMLLNFLMALSKKGEDYIHLILT